MRNILSENARDISRIFGAHSAIVSPLPNGLLKVFWVTTVKYVHRACLFMPLRPIKTYNQANQGITAGKSLNGNQQNMYKTGVQRVSSPPITIPEQSTFSLPNHYSVIYYRVVVYPSRSYSSQIFLSPKAFAISERTL